jgi:hypothetical protein
MLQKCVCVFVHPILTIKLEVKYICIRGNSFAPVSTILQLDIAAILSNRLMFSENLSVLFASKLYPICILLS